MKQLFINFFNEINLLLIEVFCSHNWRYWDVRLKSDRRSIDGRVLRRKYRRCEKCKKQQSFKMIPKNSRWDPSNITLPENSNIVDMGVTEIGSTIIESKSEKRNKKIDKVLKL